MYKNHKDDVQVLLSREDEAEDEGKRIQMKKEDWRRKSAMLTAGFPSLLAHY